MGMVDKCQGVNFIHNMCALDAEHITFVSRELHRRPIRHSIKHRQSPFHIPNFEQLSPRENTLLGPISV